MRVVVLMSLMAAAALAAGCATTGTGFGSTAKGTSSVTFQWKSSGDVSGQMTASVANKTYSGQFFQITSDTTVDTLGPLWAGWGTNWGMGGWGDWAADPQFMTQYSGRVVANLASPDGTHMRCRFQLVHPSDGMAGGGHGECQMPDGQHIDAQFPQA
jgi:hypothetical protein